MIEKQYHEYGLSTSTKLFILYYSILSIILIISIILILYT